jgi:hypothetical protein
MSSQQGTIPIDPVQNQSGNNQRIITQRQSYFSYIRDLKPKRTPELDTQDDVINILKAILQDNPQIPDYVKDYKELRDIARGEAKFQCKDCWHWNKNDTKKKHRRNG